MEDSTNDAEDQLLELCYSCNCHQQRWELLFRVTLEPEPEPETEPEPEPEQQERYMKE